MGSTILCVRFLVLDTVMVFERMVLADAFDFSFNIVLRSDKNFEWVYLVEDDLVGRGEVPDNLL